MWDRSVGIHELGTPPLPHPANCPLPASTRSMPSTAAATTNLTSDCITYRISPAASTSSARLSSRCMSGSSLWRLRHAAGSILSAASMCGSCRQGVALGGGIIPVVRLHGAPCWDAVCSGCRSTWNSDQGPSLRLVAGSVGIPVAPIGVVTTAGWLPAVRASPKPCYGSLVDQWHACLAHH